MKEKVEEIAFPDANYSALSEIASSLGVTIPENSDIELAQKFRARIPGELEPREAYMLSQIMRVTTPKNIPPKLIVYLNDRQHAGIEELDVLTVLARKKQIALNSLTSLAGAVGEKAKELKDKEAIIKQNESLT